MRYLGILFLFFLFLNFEVGASTPLILRDGTTEYFLNEHLAIFEDTASTFSIQQISNPSFQSNFEVNTKGYPYAKEGSTAYWIRIYVSNRSAINKKWVFEVLSLHTQEFQIFFPLGDDKFQMYRTGQNYNFAQREYKVKNYVFDIPPIRNDTFPIFIRVISDNQASFEYKIRTQEFFTEYSTKEYAYLGFYYGILVFLIVYTFLLFLSSREKAYLFYILYILVCILISLEGDGLGFQFLWSNNPGFNPWVSSYWIWLLFLITFIFYAKYFIDFRSSYPNLNKILVAAVLFNIFLETTEVLPDIITGYFFLLPLLILYAIAIATYFKGATSNRFFILGQTFLLISIFITRSTWFGVIPSNIFTVYSFNYGVLLEAIIFSYAFIDKYSLIKKEKEKAQQEIIHQLEQNKILQTQVTRELEKKVRERTTLLQQEKEKLNEANQKLEMLMQEVNRINSKLDYENWHLNKKVSEETKARILAREVSFEEFKKIFPADFSCLKFLEELKWSNGYKCKKCGNVKYIPLQKLLSRRCSKCTFIESATSSTLFHSLRFPINKAFYIVYHCSFSGGKMTIDELSTLLELRRNTCWNFKKKVLERLEENKKANKNIKEWEALILD